MRFRPANISVINRRASHSAVIGPAVQYLLKSTRGTITQSAVTRNLTGRSISVLRWPLHAVDDENLGQSPGRFQLETKLLLYCRE
jgi:hypothetical protein